MARQMNDEITKVGLEYCSQTDSAQVIVAGDIWKIAVPLHRVGELCKLFPDMNWKDGDLVSRIKGRYVRVTFDDCMQVYAIHHITKSIDYIVDGRSRT